MDQGTAHWCFCGILWIWRHQYLISSEKSVQPCWNARRTVLFFCRANQGTQALGSQQGMGRWNSNKWQWLPPHATIKMLVKTPFLYCGFWNHSPNLWCKHLLAGIPVQSIAESFLVGTADSTFSRFALLQADFFSPQSERRWSDQTTSLFEPSGISHLDPFGRIFKKTQKSDAINMIHVTDWRNLISQDDWPRLLDYIGLVAHMLHVWNIYQHLP